MRVLCACEYSGEVRRALRALGHDAWSCDLLPAEDGSPWHRQQDVRELLDMGWDLMIGHPPCTFLSRAGWHWVNKPDSSVYPLKGEPRRQAAKEAAAFFMLLWNAPIPRIAIENPRPIVHANLPPHSQVIQPWQFGHGETKATCLWLKNLPKLVPTNIVEGREARIHRMPPGKDRSKERSRTYTGIAKAMAEQWGSAP
jgi:hypothetical protein